MTAPQKQSQNNHRPLNVTQQARHRVFVGLGWDPNQKKSLMDRAREILGRTIKSGHDLDLSCFLYDKSGGFIESVSVHSGREIDATGHIYHSGDNREGIGEGDDEQISVELKDLDANIHHIVFCASIKSAHIFGDIKSPEIRLGDGYSNHTFLRAPLDQPEGKDKSAFAFARIYRDGGDGWLIDSLNQFFKNDGPEEKADYLKKFLG